MSIQQNKFKAIADTIRACLGTESSISPDSFAEKVNAVSESSLSNGYTQGKSESDATLSARIAELEAGLVTEYEKGYEKGLEEADGVKMACGYMPGADSSTFSVSGLGFKPKDIRIFSPHGLTTRYQVAALVWKESVGGYCWMANADLVSCMKSTLQDSDVTTSNNGFSATCTASPYSLPVFSSSYYWFAFAEEQEGGYV